MLSENNATYSFRNISKEPPTAEELQELIKKGNLTLKQLINTKSQTFKKLKPDLDSMDEKEIINLIQSNPSIMVRPILADNNRILIGFKETDYLEFVKN